MFADWLWGNVLGYLLLIVGLYFSVRLGFPQIKHFKRAFKNMFSNMKKVEDGTSGFGVMMAALGGQIGTGSLVGVASAILAGGPGAIFWMWMTAVFGMAITYGEAILGQIFREKKQDNYTGGPAYYIDKGLGLKWISVIMSILYVLGIGFAIASLQTYSIAQVFTGVMDINPTIIGIIVTILAMLVIFGGVSRISMISEKLVPFMGITYILFIIAILFMNIGKIPSVFYSIFKGAFSPISIGGGVIGWTVADAFRQGLARGMFSNDAGNGAIATMHASTKANHPVNQGLLAMIGTFITTIVVCTATALAILSTDVLSSNEDGVLLLQKAFSSNFGSFGAWIIVFATVLFCFTTLVADMSYGEANLSYIFKKKDKLPKIIYRVVLSIFLVVACTKKLDLIWAIIDVSVGFIVVINVVSMILLFRYIKYVSDDYFEQDKIGKDILWDYDKNIKEIL